MAKATDDEVGALRGEIADLRHRVSLLELFVAG